MAVTLGTVLFASFLAALVATPMVRAGAWRLGLLDRPNERSSHRRVTARAGGLAIALGVAAGLWVVGLPDLGDPGFRALIVGALLLAGMGLLDDRFGLPPWPRLAVQVAAASLLVWATGGLQRVPLPPPLDVSLGGLGPLVSVLWIVGVTNFYNFMDGIDGLAGLQGAVTAGALALAMGPGAPATLLAGGLAGACAGFLVYNWAPASVFLGDTGSGLLGYTLAGLSFLAPGGRESEATLMVAVSLWLFLADAGTCLGQRVVKRARWHEAHREHLYQRWVACGTGHARVALWIGLGSLVLTGLALVGWRTGNGVWYWIALGVGLSMTAAEWLAVRRVERVVAGRQA